MKVYHGSSVVVKHPLLGFSRDLLDFGKGFYTTPLKDQACKWAARFAKGSRAGVVNRYEIPDDFETRFSTKRFEGYTREWLDYVAACRLGKDCEPSEIIVGSIANDKVFNTVELFFEGLIDEDTALGRLKFEEPNLQICFKTQKAMDEGLFFLGSEEVHASE